MKKVSESSKCGLSWPVSRVAENSTRSWWMCTELSHVRIWWQRFSDAICVAWTAWCQSFWRLFWRHYMWAELLDIKVHRPCLIEPAIREFWCPLSESVFNDFLRLWKLSCVLLIIKVSALWIYVAHLHVSWFHVGHHGLQSQCTVKQWLCLQKDLKSWMKVFRLPNEIDDEKAWLARNQY